MCLAIPSKIVELKQDNIACVEVLGTRRDISLDLVSGAKKGDYVLVHAGFAIDIVDKEYALESLEVIKEIPELADIR